VVELRSATRRCQRRGLHGLVVEDLGRHIVSGAAPPGQRLPQEPALAVEYDVSRTVVREALRVLAAKGLLDARPMRGTLVRPRRDWRLLDPDLLRWSLESEDVSSLLRHLLDVRLMVEPAAARLAAERASGVEREAIERACDGLVGSLGDPEAFIEADLALHGAIIAATGNPLLGELIAAIETALRLGRRIQVRVAGSERPLPSGPVEAHREVVAAVIAGRGRRAEAAMRRVVEAAARDAEAVLARRDSEAPLASSDAGALLASGEDGASG